jgi:hypothetical protein
MTSRSRTRPEKKAERCRKRWILRSQRACCSAEKFPKPREDWGRLGDVRNDGNNSAERKRQKTLEEEKLQSYPLAQEVRIRATQRELVSPFATNRGD